MAAVITSSSAVRPVNNGDTVRVVLEGKASDVEYAGVGLSFQIDRGQNANYITASGNHVVSVEVIKPAMPKVGDVFHRRRDLTILPVGSVITNGYNETLAVTGVGTVGVNVRNGYEFYLFGGGDNNPPYTVRYIPE